MGCANSILIKLNQIGSVSETLEAIKMHTKPDTRQLLHIVLARLRILQSLTWQLRLTHARLKQEHRQDLSVSQNTISFFALKSNLEIQLYILESEHLT